jgi:hypothetical protein
LAALFPVVFFVDFGFFLVVFFLAFSLDTVDNLTRFYVYFAAQFDGGIKRFPCGIIATFPPVLVSFQRILINSP